MDTKTSPTEAPDKISSSLDVTNRLPISVQRRNLLVDPYWFCKLISYNNHIDANHPETYVILEVSFTVELITNENFQIKFPDQQASPFENSKIADDSDVHIPGAIRLHPSYFEAGRDFSKYFPRYETYEDGNLLPDNDLIEAVLDLGITADTLVVVVGNVKEKPNSGGNSLKGHAVSAMAAARVVWSLMYCGVKDVRMLDGGGHAWRLYRKDCQTPIIAKHRTIERPERFNASNECTGKHFLATTAEVAELANVSPGVRGVLLDVRRLGEHNGTKTDAYPFFNIAGSIPNAVYQGNWDILVDLHSGKLKTVNEIEAYWRRELGVDFDNLLSGFEYDQSDGRGGVIFYCGTGWRSSISFLLAYMMGWPMVKNYDDGWYGWCSLVGQ